MNDESILSTENIKRDIRTIRGNLKRYKANKNYILNQLMQVNRDIHWTEERLLALANLPTKIRENQK